ncbi:MULTISPECIES: hypothetical protein [unclassified Microcoleus]|uniref:hypothetical protein n=1 Tax=unclassified Microcoleus TaxID=2642155 RepID=UPI002FD3572A
MIFLVEVAGAQSDQATSGLVDICDFRILANKNQARRLAMAKRDRNGNFICDRCGSTDMKAVNNVKKGYGTTRLTLICNSCKEEDYYDITEGGD